MTTYTLSDSTQFPYGYGLQLNRSEDFPVINHGSSYPGYTAKVWYSPGSKILVTAFSNSMQLINLVKKIGLVSKSKPLDTPDFIQLSEQSLLPLNAKYRKGNDQWVFEVVAKANSFSRNQGNIPLDRDAFRNSSQFIFC